MKKIREVRKLALSKTTVRLLSGTELKGAAGGEVDSNCGSCNGSCGANTCFCSVMACSAGEKGCIVLD